ncbi:hypothetical protein NKI12_28670 [Mesorhizobium australicum]|uniref:Uncharacterized protein n=1 Tax=Mesorhizobium australicum TaxID=536018 RepID=A0ACC6T7P7_9HYPH
MLLSSGEDTDDRVAAQNGFGAAQVDVASIRATFNRLDDKKKPYQPLGIAYTPIDSSERFGPNPYHCDIFPQLGNPGRNNLHLKTLTIQLDQEKAKAAWEKRHGIADV